MSNIQINSVEELEKHLELWLAAYEKGEPLVPDDEYDHYKRLLVQHKPESKLLQKIGNKPKRNKETLPFILGSLSNKFEDDIQAWLDKHDNGFGFVLSHKLDGLAIECEYTNDKLINAWLRGDHYIGENITAKALKFIPNRLKASGPTSYRTVHFKGEILLNCEPEDVKKDDGTPYKTKRNAAAGIINRDDGKNLDKLYVIFHTWADPDGPRSNREHVRIGILEDFTNCVKNEFVQKKEDITSVAKRMIEEKTQYDKDGIVITVNNSEVENIKIPEKKIAFKFNKQSAETEVDHIEWNTSRTGDVVPLVYIKPVTLGGATISKTAGFNAKNIMDNNIDTGAIIKIVRSGDVIPYIENVITPAKLIELPTTCPSCNNILRWDSTKVHLICDNINCPAQVQKKIAHFFEELGLENFSEKMLTSLNCNSVTEVLNLKKEDILKIDGWAEKSADDFLNRLKEVITNITPQKLLAALGVENLGTSSSKLILENISFLDLLDSLYDDKKLANVIVTLINIKGLGEKKVKSIIRGLSQNKLFLSQFMDNHIISVKPKTGKLTGKSFCITGALSRPRDQIEKWIESNGGSISSISSCSYLVCNSPSDSSKYKKAQQRNIPIITELQLNLMVTKT